MENEVESDCSDSEVETETIEPNNVSYFKKYCVLKPVKKGAAFGYLFCHEITLNERLLATDKVSDKVMVKVRQKIKDPNIFCCVLCFYGSSDSDQ